MVLRVSEPCAEIIDGVLAGSDLAVEALGLDVDVVKAVLLAQVEVFEYGVVFAETVAASLKPIFIAVTPFSVSVSRCKTRYSG